MTSKHDKIETRVKKHLDAVHAIEGGWDALLDIVHRRGIQRHLREVRILKGLKQADVAKIMDISQATLSEMETARYPDYRLSTLRRWAFALDTRIEWQVFEKVVEDEPEEARPNG